MKCSVFHPGGRVFFFALCVILILTLALGIFMAPRAAEARQPVKVHRIGVLMFTSSPVAIEELRQGLHELGYVEGRNLTLEVRSAEGRAERLADLAAELVHLPVDLIVAHTTAGVLAAKHATTTLPIVAAVMTDPVQTGSAESLAHPGGNITGSFSSRLELQSIDDLKALSVQVVGRGGPTALPEHIQRMPGDLIVVLSDGDFISFATHSLSGAKVLVGIRSHQLYPLTLPNVARNVIAHELGHAIGLGHNDDPTTLMCGRPAPCRPAAFQSQTERFFPLTKAEKVRLMTMYPPHWQSR